MAANFHRIIIVWHGDDTLNFIVTAASSVGWQQSTTAGTRTSTAATHTFGYYTHIVSTQSMLDDIKLKL